MSAELRAPEERRRRATTARARRAVERANARDAKGPGGRASQRALRNTAVIARLEGGATSREVAREFGIGERTVRLIAETANRWTTPLTHEPMQILNGVLRDYDRAVQDFLALAFRYEASSPAAAVAALRGALQARERHVELLSLVGKLPEDLETFVAQSVLQRLADEMVDLMGRVESGELSAADAGRRFRDMTRGWAAPALEAA